MATSPRGGEEGEWGRWQASPQPPSYGAWRPEPKRPASPDATSGPGSPRGPLNRSFPRLRSVPRAAATDPPTSLTSPRSPALDALAQGPGSSSSSGSSGDNARNMGIAALEQGHSEQARAHYAQAASVYGASLGEEDQTTQEAKRMAERLQGLAAYDQGEHGRALELWGQTLQVLRNTFPDDVSRLAFSGLV